MLLELLNEAFPEGETLPSNYYEAKKKYSVTLAFIISRLMHAPQITRCIQKSMQMQMSVLFMVSLDGNQVMSILQMSSLIQQRKRKFLLRFCIIFPKNQGFKGYICHLRQLLT